MDSSGDEDEVLSMGERDWQKMRRALLKSGYREGASKGKEEALQKSFDAAYQLTFKHALMLGKLEGWIEATTKTTPEMQEPLKSFLEKVAEHRTIILTTDVPPEANGKTVEDIDRSLAEQFDQLLHQLYSVHPDLASTAKDIFK